MWENEENGRKKKHSITHSCCDLHGKTFAILKLITEISSNAELRPEVLIAIKSGHCSLSKATYTWQRSFILRADHSRASLKTWVVVSSSTELWGDTFPVLVVEQMLQDVMWVIQSLPTFCVDLTGEICSICSYLLAPCLFNGQKDINYFDQSLM